MIRSKTIRIFISSTFNDYIEEREVLRSHVFPALRHLCAEYGARFQEIDLRWGISAEAGLDHQTIRICLKEIERCQRISPRPNFIILIGDRYGWQPVPDIIPARELDLIRGWLNAADTQFVQDWYLPDANAAPLEYYLKPRSGEYQDYTVWSGVEEKLRRILRRAVDSYNLLEISRDEYYLSATGHEILHGALNPPPNIPEVKGHVFCFERRIMNLHYTEEDVSFWDPGPVGSPDPEARRLLTGLKGRIEAKLGGNVTPYQTFWQSREGKLGPDYLQQFIRDVREKLEPVIRAQLRQIEHHDPHQAEIEEHEEFARARSRGFLVRMVEMEHLIAFLAQQMARPLVLSGKGGLGKTSLLAAAGLRSREVYPERNVIIRFIGITAASTNPQALLDSICREIAEDFKLTGYTPAASYRQQIDLFHMYLSMAEAKKPLVIFVDGLDQLLGENLADSLSWIPAVLPARVHLILALARGSGLKLPQETLPQAKHWVLKPLPPEAAAVMLDTWLREAGRTLQPEQNAFVRAYVQRTRSPLYLKLVFEEVKHWKSVDMRRLKHGTRAMITAFFSELSLASRHGRVLVHKSIGYLAASRYGLSEEEIIGLLSADRKVMADLKKRSAHSTELEQIPFAVWSRLYHDMEQFLAEKEPDNVITINFFHRHFTETARRLYYERDKTVLHGQLAAYFRTQAYFQDEQRSVPNLRMLSELPYHLLQAGMVADLGRLLSDMLYLSAKLQGGKWGELADELHLAYSSLSENGQRSDAARLVQVLFDFFLSLNGVENSVLSLETIHAAFIYRKKRDFYQEFLELGIREEQNLFRLGLRQDIYVCFSARKANFQRREGCLTEAEQVYRKIVPYLEKQGHLPQELARAYYDNGYIKYLQGAFVDAARNLALSTEVAGSAGDEVGEWISRCVEYNVKALAGLDEGNQDNVYKFLDILDQAYKVFDAARETSLSAERWVMNVNAHRFKMSYYLGDLAKATGYYLKLKNDRWYLSPDNAQGLLSYEARLELLNRHYDRAAELLKSQVEPFLAPHGSRSPHNMESVVELFWEYGYALYHANRMEWALEVWAQGLACPDQPGNQIWKRKITRWLQAEGITLQG